jgi:DNA-binding transcriptional MerR regulator
MTLILRGRRFGFSLEEIRQWLLIYQQKGTRAAAADLPRAGRPPARCTGPPACRDEAAIADLRALRDTAAARELQAAREG